MNGEILKVLGSSRQEHNWGSYLQWVQNRFFKEQFERGKLHGQCPERFDNENVGHAMPCPVYQVGYVCGTHERLLIEQKIPRDEWENWILLAEVKDIRYPLSSPAKYSLIQKDSTLSS
ncbi:MAG TPA: hypothetical protein DCE56_39675 [Cyanobacteria bacterium UBA8553]|jgi:hypothetical protein|nr:hypothetical protein [Cyanobacteria bacterium UBA8553]